MSNQERWEPDDTADEAIDEMADVLRNTADYDVTWHHFAASIAEALDRGEIPGYGRLPS